ncbi:MAG TPA: glycosyl hydrolase [Anaerolineae bacterium]
MTTIFVAMRDEVLVVRRREDGWQHDIQLQGKSPRCLAADPLNSERVCCGTEGLGVWCSNDGGITWYATWDGVPHDIVTAVAVSSLQQTDEGTVYAGTEPSAIFRSQDGGASWQICSGLTELPSASTWSFPPKPDTHHVRWIEPDPVVAGRLFVCIEAGALVRSHDGGQTWKDRVPGGPYDTHKLATHPLAPGRLYSAAGDGYFESDDGGATWRQPEAGLQHHYLYGLAVDPVNPDTVLVSAASGANQAHNARAAESLIYRKTAGEKWQPVHDGLPEARGMTISILAANTTEPGTFYAANNHGLFRSADAGLTWEQLDVAWSGAYRSQRVNALIVVEIV